MAEPKKIKQRDANGRRKTLKRSVDTDVEFGDDQLLAMPFGAHHGRLDVEAFVPTGQEAVGLRIRRLVAIKINRVPVWREDPA
ncbi:hypothetical protein NKH19_28560 [Mesorhizobium sp. M1338]|uniref:hypothetical protein n=1 Tax=unclassified Mesorhizobium TaxID=325217 RepID=UPI0033366A2B